MKRKRVYTLWGERERESCHRRDASGKWSGGGRGGGGEREEGVEGVYVALVEYGQREKVIN